MVLFSFIQQRPTQSIGIVIVKSGCVLFLLRAEIIDAKSTTPQHNPRMEIDDSILQSKMQPYNLSI